VLTLCSILGGIPEKSDIIKKHESAISKGKSMNIEVL